MTDEFNSDLAFASDVTARRLDEVQFELGEGPTIDAFRHGYPVLVPDVEGISGAVVRRPGWPGFSRAARESGAGAIFALPLRVGAIRVGVLLVYRVEPGELDADALGRALRFADALTYALLGPVALGGNGEDQHDSVIDGLHADTFDASSQDLHRAVVHQASGVLAVQLGIGVDVALARLRGHAFAEGLALSEVARLVIAGDLRLEAQ